MARKPRLQKRMREIWSGGGKENTMFPLRGPDHRGCFSHQPLSSHCFAVILFFIPGLGLARSLRFPFVKRAFP